MQFGRTGEAGRRSLRYTSVYERRPENRFSSIGANRTRSSLSAALCRLPCAGRGARQSLRGLLAEHRFPRRTCLHVLRSSVRPRSRQRDALRRVPRRSAIFDKARAVMRYDEKSRGPILALKHGYRLDLIPGFARWLGRAGRVLLDDANLIVPVPLHPGRLWRRRYNQAAELARALGQIAVKQVDPFSLRRVRATPSQGAMPSAAARRRNMRGAFQVLPSRQSGIESRTILLVDDVLTTGATADACARVLKRAGATKVHVLALARVVRPLTGLI
jgi:ComF family protein